MRARVMALALTGLLAAGAPTALVSGASAATKPPKAGQTCNSKKTPPKGFTCKKNSKGKFTLHTSKSKTKKGTGTTTTGR